MTICFSIIFASSLCLPRYANTDRDEHPAVMCTVVCPLSRVSTSVGHLLS
jgi:hypothetical protein